MLLMDMNARETLIEFMRDIPWLNQRSAGLVKKYHSHCIKNKQLHYIATHQYKTPRNNDGFVRVYGDKKGIYCFRYFRIYDGRDTQYLYWYGNSVDNKCYVMLATSHFIRRWSERHHGDNIGKFFAEMEGRRQFIMNEDNNKSFGMDDGIVFFDIEVVLGLGAIIVLKTFVSNDLLHDNQLEEKEKLKKYNDIVREFGGGTNVAKSGDKERLIKYGKTLFR